MGGQDTRERPGLCDADFVTRDTFCRWLTSRRWLATIRVAL
jgi:hypothetical protein